MTFKTESETEHLLESSTRWLPLPDGRQRSVRLSEFQWETYDYVTTKLGVTQREVTGWAKQRIQAQPELDFHQVVRERTLQVIDHWKSLLKRYDALLENDLSNDQLNRLQEAWRLDRQDAVERCRRGEQEGF